MEISVKGDTYVLLGVKGLNFEEGDGLVERTHVFPLCTKESKKAGISEIILDDKVFQYSESSCERV